MTGRERLQAALSFGFADRVPTLEVCLPRVLVEKATGRAIEDPWRSLLEVAGYLDADGMVMPIGAPAPVDCLGIEQPEEPPARARRCGRAIWASVCGILCRVAKAMAWEEILRMAMKDPARLDSICQAALAELSREVELLGTHGFEAVVVMDDLAGRRGLVASPALLRRFLFERYREWLEARPLPVIFHSDGNVSKIVEDIARAGFAGIHGCEEAAGMDVSELCWAYRGRLVFAGGFALQAWACDASSKQRRCGAKRAERCALAGGYIGGSDGGISGESEKESLRLLHRALHALPLCPARGW